MRRTAAERKQKSKLSKFLGVLFYRKIVLISAIIVLIFLFMAITAPVIAPYSPYKQNLLQVLREPSAQHLLGTDQYGRDLLTRLIYGTQVSLIVGVLAVFIGFAIGIFLGLIAGFLGKIADTIIMRVAEAMLAIPQVILALALVALLGQGLLNLTLLLGISIIPAVIRMMRGQVLSVKETDFIMANKLSGASKMRVMLRHVLPNSISPLIVLATQLVGNTILTEAALSFLGFGIAPPMASWGGMIYDGNNYLTTQPLFSLAPGIFIILLVLALNIFGDGLRDTLDPRLRGVK